VIVAATGKGKSVFCNRLTTSYLGLGAKIWTIDVGRSYEKTAYPFQSACTGRSSAVLAVVNVFCLCRSFCAEAR
jgi:conjugal transfer ATP-binding protein TraC